MQRLLSKAAAGLVLAIMAGAMMFVGVTFIAYAIAVALSPSLGVAGGAAVAGGILLVGPMFWVLVTLLSRPPKPKADPNSAMGFLSALAKDKPLMAVAAAVLVGAADMLLKRRNRS
jgi:hypothetical protein